MRALDHAPAGADQQIATLERARRTRRRPRSPAARRRARHDRAAAPEADERARQGRSRPPGRRRRARRRRNRAIARPSQELRAHQAPCPTNARRAPAPRRGWRAPRAPRRGSTPHPRAARTARPSLPGAGRARAGAALPGLDEADSQLTRLKADRERLGGVNLQADEDLTGHVRAVRRHGQGEDRRRGAIAKLRAGISQINSEGREPPADRLRHGQRAFPASCSPRCSAAARRELEMIEARRPARGRARDRRQAARQEAGDAVAAVGRRAVADGAWR